MTVGHIFVIIFMLITAGFIVWLEMNSRKNTEKKKKETQEHGSGQIARDGSR
jgi:hypothetical protein